MPGRAMSPLPPARLLLAWFLQTRGMWENITITSRISCPSRSLGARSVPRSQPHDPPWRGTPQRLQLLPAPRTQHGDRPGTHLAHSKSLAPVGFLQDPTSRAPSDSPGHLSTLPLQQERGGTRSNMGNFRGSRDAPGRGRTQGSHPKITKPWPQPGPRGIPTDNLGYPKPQVPPIPHQKAPPKHPASPGGHPALPPPPRHRAPRATRTGFGPAPRHGSICGVLIAT